MKSAVPYDYTAGICVNGSESTRPNTGIDRVLNTGDVRAALFGGIRDQSDLDYKQFPTFSYAYYLKSKSDAVIYRENPIEIPGTFGITDEELLKQETFAGFDFDKVWKMGANGPELANVPA